MGPPVKQHLHRDAAPRFLKAGHALYTLRTKVSEVRDRLLAEEVLSPVTDAEWAKTIFKVVKKNLNIQICGDCKITLNAACHTE